jgi:hypothetical protein
MFLGFKEINLTIVMWLQGESVCISVFNLINHFYMSLPVQVNNEIVFLSSPH